MTAKIIPLKAVDDWSEFGECPKCHRNDGYLNVRGDLGMEHFFICRRHKLKWYVGTNLFSTWQHMSKDALLWQEYASASYQTVKPWHPQGEPPGPPDPLPPDRTVYDNQGNLLFAEGYVRLDDEKPKK